MAVHNEPEISYGFIRFGFSGLQGSDNTRGTASGGALVILMGEMRKPEIAKQLARRSRLSQGEAADRLDVIFQKIVSDLRKGREPVLPGLGRFKHGPDGQVMFEPEVRKRHE